MRGNNYAGANSAKSICLDNNGIDELEKRGNTSEQKHTHEFLGSVQIAAAQANLLHKHRFAGVIDETSFSPDGSHYHRIVCKTDYTKGHFHIIECTTGPDIKVGGDGHVHYVTGDSSLYCGHCHGFRFVTLIWEPA